MSGDFDRWDAEKFTDVNGVRLYPILMRNYGEWCKTKNVLAIRQSTLPASLISLPYLSALFAVDTANKTGFMSCLRTIISLSTRVAEEKINVYVDANDQQKLTCIACDDKENPFRITPQSFNRIRKEIAKLNAFKLPDESENVELVQSAEMGSQSNSVSLKWDIPTMISSVAYAYHVRPLEIQDWTISEFDDAYNAINRSKRFLISAISETSQKTVEFKGGNPYPDWCFERDRTGHPNFRSINSFLDKNNLSIPGLN